MKGISLKGRLSKKRLIGVLAGLIVAGGAGGYVLQSGMLVKEHAEAETVEASGVACTTTDFIKLNRGGQRWLRKYIRTDSADGLERVRTALRVAGVLAKSEQADLYQVVVLDNAGPEGRANLRGAAIGAEVLFAPDPTRLPGMEEPFIARYATGKANTVGLFYGERVELSSDDIRSTMTEITDRSDCQTMVADASAPVEGEGGSGHGKPAGAHGAAASGAHGEAASGGEHGEASSQDTAEGHGATEAGAAHDAAEPTGDHGAPEGAEAHGEAKTEAASEGGWMSSVMNMIPGMGGATENKTSNKTAEGHEAVDGGAAEAGLLSKVMDMIPGLGTQEAREPGEASHDAPSSALADHDAPASPGVASEPHAVTHAESAGHASPAVSESAHDVAPSETPVHAETDGGHQADATHEAVTVPEHAPPEQAAMPAAHEQDTSEQKAAAPHGVAPEETGATH